ncbi:ABC transporter substrate-binding protein [soil metagenome]
MNRTTRLTTLVASLLSLAVVSACGGSSGASDASSGASPKIKIGIVQAQDFIHAMPARVAVEQGFFKDEGLDVSVVDFSAGSDLTKAMAGGSIDVGAATGLDAVSAVAHNIPLQAFYGVYSESPMALIVPTDSKITGFGDLKGAKVGISKAGSLTDFVTRAALAKNGMTVDDVTEVPLGDPGSTMAALDRGDIDAFVLPVTFGYIEAAQGKGKIAEAASDVLGGQDQFAVLMAKKDYVGSNAANLKKLAAAYTKAIEWMSGHESETVALGVKKLGAPEPIVKQTYAELMDKFTPDGKINKAGLAAYAKALPDLGIATSSPSESDYLSTTIVPAG